VGSVLGDVLQIFHFLATVAMLTVAEHVQGSTQTLVQHLSGLVVILALRLHVVA